MPNANMENSLNIKTSFFCSPHSRIGQYVHINYMRFGIYELQQLHMILCLFVSRTNYNEREPLGPTVR